MLGSLCNLYGLSKHFVTYFFLVRQNNRIFIKASIVVVCCVFLKLLTIGIRANLCRQLCDWWFQYYDVVPLWAEDLLRAGESSKRWKPRFRLCELQILSPSSTIISSWTTIVDLEVPRILTLKTANSVDRNSRPRALENSSEETYSLNHDHGGKKIYIVPKVAYWFYEWTIQWQYNCKTLMRFQYGAHVVKLIWNIIKWSALWL